MVTSKDFPSSPDFFVIAGTESSLALTGEEVLICGSASTDVSLSSRGGDDLLLSLKFSRDKSFLAALEALDPMLDVLVSVN